MPELLRLGYAITTHKAQGSGFATVVVAEPGNVTLHPHRWTYTSVTRASNQLYIVSQLNEAAWWSIALASPVGDLTRRAGSVSVPHWAGTLGK